MKKIDLSLVLACYNEESHLPQSMREIVRALDSAKYSYEIIFVDDASTDATREVIREICTQNNGWKYIFHKRNQGRGKSVSDGLLASHGRIVGFIDPDLEIPAYAITPMAKAIEAGADLACAKRVYSTSLSLNHLMRTVLSMGYAWLVKLALNMPVSDSEAGCKFFDRQKALPVLKKVRSKHWTWDTKVVATCLNEDLRVCEIPVPYVRNPLKKSTVNPLKDTIGYLNFLSANASRLRYRR